MVTTVVKFVSNVARVFASDASLLLMSVWSSLFGWCLLKSANWFAGCGVFYGLGGDETVAGVSKISSVPRFNPIMSKYGVVVCDFGSVKGL